MVDAWLEGDVSESSSMCSSFVVETPWIEFHYELYYWHMFLCCFFLAWGGAGFFG